MDREINDNVIVHGAVGVTGNAAVAGQTEMTGNVRMRTNQAVGGSSAVGNNMTVQKNLIVGGNLKVGGWLSVKNLNFPSEGVFLSDTDLPEPKTGHIAGVIEQSGSEFRVRLYVVDSNGTSWVATDHYLPINIEMMVDGGNVDEQTLQEWQEQIEEQLEAKANADDLEFLPVAGHSDRKGVKLKEGMSEVFLTEHQDISGKANREELNTVHFNGIRTAERALPGSTDTRVDFVVYDSRGRFYGVVEDVQTLTPSTTFYIRWSGDAEYNTYNNSNAFGGICDKLFVDDVTGKVYYKASSRLREVQTSQADKAYAPTSYSGMGKVYLRKNMMNSLNLLTQDMVAQSNTIYVVEYDYRIGDGVVGSKTCTFTDSLAQQSNRKTKEYNKLAAAQAAYDEDPTEANLAKLEAAQDAYEAIGSIECYPFVSVSLTAGHALHISGNAFQFKDAGLEEVVETDNGIIYAEVDTTVYIGCMLGTYTYRYDSYLQLPGDSILLFDGGTLSNGTLKGNGTQIVAQKSAIFTGVAIGGVWNVPEITSAWFSDAANNNGLKNVFALQNAEVHNRIVVEKLTEHGEYSVSSTKEGDSILQCLSNLDLVVDGDIVLLPNGYESYNIVSIAPVIYTEDDETVTINRHHITISGSGTIKGDKDEHTGIDGQWGHGIYVSGSNVTVRDIAVKDCWGDCITIGRSKAQTGVEIENVVVENCRLDNGRRQGISVTHGGNIVLLNCRITNVGTVNGHNPKAAIDIEPNENCYADNVTVENCRVEDCELGIVIYGRGRYTKSCITIDNCYIQCVRRAFAVNGISSAIKITNNEVHTRFHAVDADTTSGAQDNIILFENNMIVQQPYIDPNRPLGPPEEAGDSDDMSQDARGVVIYARKGDYCFRHNAITCNSDWQGNTLPVFRFASGNKFIEDNDITCGELFYAREFDNVRITGNRITGNVTLPGPRTIFENNTVSGLLKSTAEYQTTDDQQQTVTVRINDNQSIVRGNFITNMKDGNAIVEFRRRIVVDSNRFINIALKMTEGVVSNNIFTYNNNFALTGILLNVAFSDFVNNTVDYAGDNGQDANIYMVDGHKSIVGNNMISASRIQYVFYHTDGDGCHVSGNSVSLPEGHAVDHIIKSLDCTIIPAVRNSGTKSERPVPPYNDRYYVGCRYYDTTHGKPNYWNGKFWVDAAGTRVTYAGTFTYTHLKATNTSQPDAGETYETTLSPVTGYSLPASITVQMGLSTLVEGTDYTYTITIGDTPTAVVEVLGTGGTGGVTDELVITATGVANE